MMQSGRFSQKVNLKHFQLLCRYEPEKQLEKFTFK